MHFKSNKAVVKSKSTAAPLRGKGLIAFHATTNKNIFFTLSEETSKETVAGLLKDQGLATPQGAQVFSFAIVITSRS